MTFVPSWRRRVASRTAMFTALLAAVPAEAIDLRGRVEEIRSYSSAPFPVNAAKVELLDASSRSILMLTYSGADGLYYLRGVNPGRYVVRAGGLNYAISVAPAPPAQNIAPVRLRR